MRFNGSTGKSIQNSGVLIDGSNNISGVGTLSAGAAVVTSSSLNALAVGASGTTNPALRVDCSTASSATGVVLAGKAAGAGVTLTAISSGTNEAITLGAKGAATATLNAGSNSILAVNGTSIIGCTATTASIQPGTRAFTANAALVMTLATGTSLTSATESNAAVFNFSNTQTHAAGAIATQRDMRVQPSTHAFASASTITDAAAFAVDGAPIAGSNASITNSSTLYSAGQAVGAGTANSYGLNIAANSGAANNFVFRFAGSAGELINLRTDGKFSLLATNTAAGTTGAQTINKPSGTVNAAAGASALVVTNSLCSASSIVFAVVRTNDATAGIRNVVPAAGSFTINLSAAATGETSIGFFIIN